MLACPTTQPREPTFGNGFHAHHDSGHVVGAAVFVRQIDKFFGGSFRIDFGLKRAGDFRLGNHSRKTVRTKQENVAGKKRLLFSVDFNFLLCAEGAKKNALHVAAFGFGKSQNTAANLLGDKRMIAGELLQAAGAEKIGAAVTDVRNAQFVVFNPSGGEGCAHAALLGIGFRGFKNFSIGEINGARKAFGTVAPACFGFSINGSCGIIFGFEAVLDNGFDSESAGNFAVCFAAHAIREDEQVQRIDDAETVLVVGAHTTDVGLAATYNSHTDSSSRCRCRTTPLRLPIGQLYSHASKRCKEAKAPEPY